MVDRRPTSDDILIGDVEKRTIVVADYDPRWPVTFRVHAAMIAGALAAKALTIEHIGSTSVPGLGAKPIVDLLVVVQGSGDETASLPALVQARCCLRVREPDWHQHRQASPRGRAVAGRGRLCPGQERGRRNDHHPCLCRRTSGGRTHLTTPAGTATG